jgi:hypothetical protein
MYLFFRLIVARIHCADNLNVRGQIDMAKAATKKTAPKGAVKKVPAKKGTRKVAPTKAARKGPVKKATAKKTRKVAA